MFLKYKVMKRINNVGFPNTITLDTLIRDLDADNDKILIALDILGCKGYVYCDASQYPTMLISLRNLSSFVRYKHDMKICVLEWIIKIGSFLAVIVSLLFTEALQSALLKVPNLISQMLSLL